MYCTLVVLSKDNVNTTLWIKTTRKKFKNLRYMAGLNKCFQKSSIHLKISGTRKVTRSKFHTDDPQILGESPGVRDLSTTSITYFPNRLNLINMWTWTVLWLYISNLWFTWMEFDTNNIHYTTLSLNLKEGFLQMVTSFDVMKTENKEGAFMI